MRIYKISHEEYSYDSYNGHVIVANTKDEVRDLAMSICANEGKDIWIEAGIIKIYGEYTGEHKVPFIIMSSFNAG